MKRTEPQSGSTRNIDADYIESYRQQFATALKTGRRAHAERIAAALAEYGVKVTVPAERTEAAVQPPLDATTAAPTPETAARPPAKRTKPKPKASGASAQS